MTRVLSFNNTHAEAQQEVFAQLENAGRRFPVVFSHFLFTCSNDNNIRKGAHYQLTSSAPGASARRLSHNSTKEVTNSLPVTGRPASTSSKRTNNLFLLIF